MINREEALKSALSIFPYPSPSYKIEDFVNTIYDSIGSCGECEHKSNTRERFCVNIGSSVPDNFFCADFERKQYEVHT